MSRSLLALLVAFLAPLTAEAKNISSTVRTLTDVWSEPAADTSTLTNDKRETQLLPGEHVFVRASSGSWVRIEAVEQPEFTHHQHWEGYPGWILWSSLGGPAKITDLPPPKSILDFAQTEIGIPYLWGGMSRESGFDCSGLVHLAYRQNGKTIPRDAHEQWMKAKPIKRMDLQPADLIFSAKADNPKKIVHVALYTGDGTILEAPQTGMNVRTISFKDKFGKDFSSVESGDTVGDRVIYFGTFRAQ